MVVVAIQWPRGSTRGRGVTDDLGTYYPGLLCCC